MTKEEAVRRIKLCIDRQKNGDFPALFGPSGEIRIVVYDKDVCFVKTPGGDFGIFHDGTYAHANIQRVN